MGDLEQPLLQRKNHDNCPGCKLQRKKDADRGPPKLELFYVAVIVLCNSLPISSLFPFIYFMVRDFKIAKDDKDIGFYAGYLGSVFMLGRFISSIFWGWFSDRFGRKPVFTIGTASIIVFNTMFGFSENFWMALISRFLLGAFNGMMGPIRAYASEICREEHQALGLSMIGTVWGLGLMIGPALGGYLAQPSLKYPMVFPKGSLFDRFPYSLPCLIISLFAVASLFSIIWLPESFHNHSLEIPNLPKDVDEKDCFDRNGKRRYKHRNSKEEHDGAVQEINKEKIVMEKQSILRNWGLVASSMVYCLWGLHDMAYSEIFSLWAVSPREYTGLGLTTSDVGVVLAISGAALLMFQLFIFPPLANYFGPIVLSRTPAMLTMPLIVVYPFISRLHGILLWVILICASMVKNILSIAVVTGSFLLINNSVTSDQRGVANGISLSGMSLFRAIGPACAGAIFSWSQKRLDASFLPGTWMVFFILGVLCLITVVSTFEPILPRSLNKPKPEFDVQMNEQEEQFKRHSSFSY